MIHQTAVVHPRAEIDGSVVIGPYAVIEEGVKIGPDCRIGPHVHISGLTTIGPSCLIYSGAVVGEAPQDMKFKGGQTRLRIGERNTIREHVTIHRSSEPGEETVLGSNNLFM